MRTTDGTRHVGGAQSIRRAMVLLRCINEAGRDGRSVVELALASGIDRTTVYRILRCLVEEGLLDCLGQRRRYVLGPLAYEIGLAAGERVDLRKICRPALARIAAETGDSVFLMSRVGYDSVCSDRLEGSYPVKTLVVDIGNRRPLGIGAGSLAILSALPTTEAEAALAHNADRLLQFPGMSVDRVRRLAARARTDQCASLEVTGIPSVRALAVALHTPGGHAIGALSVAAIKSRMTTERRTRILSILRREAQALTTVLGGTMNG